MVPGSSPLASVHRSSVAATTTNVTNNEPQDTGDDRDQPLYVNAKQYHRILKRRQARAKLEASGKIPKERRVIMSGVEISFLPFADVCGDNRNVRQFARLLR
jgi:CCAAT-binding transcription factor (CBF-B/NF-YA) subunit B